MAMGPDDFEVCVYPWGLARRFQFPGSRKGEQLLGGWVHSGGTVLQDYKVTMGLSSLAPSLSQIRGKHSNRSFPLPPHHSRFPPFRVTMTRHGHFPRGPSPYPPPASRTRTPSSSTKRPSFGSSRSNSDIAVEEGLVDDYEPNSRHGKMSTPARPSLPDRRNSLASLSVAASQSEQYGKDDPLWPRGWRPYTCLTGGFFLMFNSWGLVSVVDVRCVCEAN